LEELDLDKEVFSKDSSQVSLKTEKDDSKELSSAPKSARKFYRDPDHKNLWRSSCWH